MVEESISKEFRLTVFYWNYFIKETNQNEMVSKGYKKVFKALNYFEHLLVLDTAVTGCVSISAFASLVGTPIANTTSSVELKNSGISVEIKKHKSVVKKRKKLGKIVLLSKSS